MLLRGFCWTLAALPLLALLSYTGESQAVMAAEGEVAPAPVTPAIDPVALDKKILAEAKTDSQIMTNLTYLSDEIGPRLTGSAALKRANEWAADKMRAYGLTDVRLEGWTIPVGWERGTATVRIIEPAINRSLTVASMGWTPGTQGVIEGNVVVVTAKNTQELAAYKGKLKGAIVLQGAPATIRPVADNSMGFGGPSERRPRGEGGAPGAGGPPALPPGVPPAAAKGPDGGPPRDPERMFEQMRNFRREMRDFMRAEGALVMMMDAGKPHGLLTTTGSWQGGDDRVSGAEPLPSLFVAHEHYAQLHRLATRKGDVATRIAVEIANKFIPGPVAVYNTVGELRGSEKPDEYVVLGAHIDSWDLAQGTTDNGTGTSVVLEAARILVKSGIKPKRTIRFVLFSGEEQGLYGSKAYVKTHQSELPKTSMALVHDTGTGKVLGLGLQGRAAVKPILEAELTSLKEVGMTEINLRGMGGTDHASFEQAGVPGFSVQQDPAEYRFSHHSQSDTLDKAREPDLVQGTQVLALAAVRVANLPNLLPRDKPAKEQPAASEKAVPKPAGKAEKK